MDWTAASVIVSAIGIIVTIVIASRSANNELRHNRFLQERDIAIRLLHENEFDPEWLAAKRALFEKLIFEIEFDWKTFSSRKFSPKDELGPEEKVFGHQVTMVLNHLEFICVAILTGAALTEARTCSGLPDQRKCLVISGKGAGLQGNMFLGHNRVCPGTRVPTGVIPKPAGGQGETAPAG